jgi:hypothetical protein
MGAVARRQLGSAFLPSNLLANVHSEDAGLRADTGCGMKSQFECTLSSHKGAKVACPMRNLVRQVNGCGGVVRRSHW